MKARFALVVLALLAIVPPASAAMRASSGLSLGANGGLGGEGTLTLSDFAEGFPFSARFAAGYLSLDPGDAPLARRVFVNEATNGSAEKSGHRFDLRVDARYQLKGGRLAGTWFYFGPRFSMWHGTFNFVDGNETFDVTTNQFGAGAGFEQVFTMGPHTDFTIGAGLDWYANADFKGHGSTYSPNGTSVDPKEDFTYTNADQAIAQPRFAPRVMIGMQHHIGW